MTVEIIDGWSSPLVQRVTRTIFTGTGEALMQPDGCWDFAFIRNQHGTMALRTGLTTRTVALDHAPGDEVLTISFRPDTFMPLMPGERMRDEGVAAGAGRQGSLLARKRRDRDSDGRKRRRLRGAAGAQGHRRQQSTW